MIAARKPSANAQSILVTASREFSGLFYFWSKAPTPRTRAFGTLATRRVLSCLLPSLPSSCTLETYRNFLYSTTMAKRRSNAIESDGEAEQQETQAGSSKRARFNEQANERITYAAAPAGESSKSKKKRAKKGGDADEIDDEEAEPVTLDDLHESQQAEDDLTTTDRFEQEHEEAIRQSIRNRENLSGVCTLTSFPFFLTNFYGP